MSATFGFLLPAVLARPTDPSTASPVAGGRRPGNWNLGIDRPFTCRGWRGGGAKRTCGVLSRARNRFEADWKPNGRL